MNKGNDQELTRAIVSDDPRARNSALSKIYDLCFGQIERYITRNSGSKEEAKDIFQEGVVVLFNNLAAKKFSGDSSVSTYLFSICRNLWLQNLRKRKAIDQEDYENNLLEGNEININIISEIMEKLKQDCRKLLKGFYYERKSMQELMEEFGMDSIQATKNKKLGCMKSLTLIISENNITFDRFFH